MERRDFVKTSAAGLAVAAAPSALTAFPERAPEVLVRRTTRPVIVADISSIRFKNGGPESSVERAFRGITAGEDVLDALVAGVNIPELDPEETGIGYGGLPNADGVVQLDSCCMHGPRKWAGGVAALEGVRTPSRVARAVAEYTDHHLLAGKGAQDFARELGFEIEADLNTERSRQLWLEWRRRVDPGHWLDPEERLKGMGRTGGHGGGGERGAGGGVGGSGRGASYRNGAHRSTGAGLRTDGRHRTDPREAGERMRAFVDAALDAGLSMVRDGLIPMHSFWGTTSVEAVSATGDICGVTTTSGLAWKIPGRVGDSPILGAGQYVDNDVGACGSTGRGEANLFNLCSFFIVEQMRRGMSPKDAGMAALKRVHANTIEARLKNSRGLPNFDLRFFILDKRGEYAAVALYGTEESTFAVCDENGAREEPVEGMLEGPIRD